MTAVPSKQFFLIFASTVFWASLFVAPPLRGQWPPEVKNLQVYPADTDVGAVLSSMREFSFGLGVRCQYCHVGEEGQPISSFDFASDQKPAKQRARTMLRMVEAINSDHLAKLELDGTALQVECVTCHRGAARPEQLTDILGRVAKESGADAAIERYRELREQYYGSHTYDFSEGALVRSAEGLIGAGDTDGATALLELNLVHHPESSWTLGTLGELRQRSGDLEGAISAFERLLENRPDDARIKARLEQLRQELP